MKGSINAVVFYIILKINSCITEHNGPHSLHAHRMEENLQIPCLTDQECEELEFKGFKCVNSLCTCEDKSKCQTSDLKPLVTKIGHSCKKSSQCNISQSFCNTEGRCQCIDNTIISKDARRCLNVTTKIGSHCEEDAQCFLFNAACLNNQCQCALHMHYKNGKCHKIKELGSSCHKSEDCSDTEFSRCKNNVCVCEKKYIQSTRNSSQCLLKAKEVFAPCNEDVQCSSTLGIGSVCSEGTCICADLFHYRESQNKCISNARETCSNHTDCHQPGNEERRLECIVGVCKCKSNFTEADGYCILPVPDSGISWTSLRILNVLPFVVSYFLFYIVV